MAIVGPSAPARRPYFKEVDLPRLVADASKDAKEPVFVYALTGGWPSANSAVRLIASISAVLCAFSFALIASLTSQKISKITYCVLLSITAFFAVIAGVMDSISVGITARECSNKKCELAVPDIVLNSGNFCDCSVGGWYFFTVVTDFILLAAATTCLILVAKTIVRRRGDLP